MNILTSWRPNSFREQRSIQIASNYGYNGGAVRYGRRIFPVEMLAPIPDPHRPMSNSLAYGAQWNARVVTPGAATPYNGYGILGVDSADFTPTGTASLSMKNEVVQ